MRRERNCNGAFTAYAETPARAEAILRAIGGVELPEDRGEAAILAVHTPAYVAALKTIPALWRAAGRPGEAIPYAFPVVGRRALALSRIDALLGAHSFDATTPITADTWGAAYASAQTALAATYAVLGGERAAFALCRPREHHAGADYCGGYCHLNVAAIAAQAACDAGVERVAILDIDYHHGNGTQDIFYVRSDVFYASVHADPATDYPFYWGHADERGESAGEGATLNLPLSHGTTLDAFLNAQATALEAIAAFGPGLLVVSFGADTWEGDPISHFALATADYVVLAGTSPRAAGRPRSLWRAAMRSTRLARTWRASCRGFEKVCSRGGAEDAEMALRRDRTAPPPSSGFSERLGSRSSLTRARHLRVLRASARTKIAIRPERFAGGARLSRGRIDLGLARHAACDRVGGVHDAQDVAAGERGQIGVAPAAAREFREDARIAVDAAQPRGRGTLDAVEVTAESDVRVACDPGDMLDVIGDGRDGDAGFRVCGVPGDAGRGRGGRRRRRRRLPMLRRRSAQRPTRASRRKGRRGRN